MHFLKIKEICISGCYNFQCRRRMTYSVPVDSSTAHRAFLLCLSCRNFQVIEDATFWISLFSHAVIQHLHKNCLVNRVYASNSTMMLETVRISVAKFCRELCWFMQKSLFFCGFSPQANYTDRAAAACRRTQCQLMRIEGVAWSAHRIPTAVNLHFLDPEPLLFHSSSSSVILTRLSGPRSRPTTS
jgi:hypothetical protein